MYYFFLDFIKSRLGKGFLLCLAISIIFISISGPDGPLETSQSQPLAKLPYLPKKENLWKETDPTNSSSQILNAGIEASHPNPDFKLLLLAEDEIESPPPPKDLPIASATELPIQTPWVARTPLIKSQTPVATITPISIEGQMPSQQLRSNSTKKHSSQFQRGDLIHCQLTAPISSIEPGGPVFARLTRSLVREGRVILPVGTPITGQISSIADTGHFLLAKDWVYSSPSKTAGSFQAHTQAKHSLFTQNSATGNQDGQPGLSPQPRPDTASAANEKIVEPLLKALKNFAQDRTRTVFGEEVSPNLRNLALETGSEILSSELGLNRENKSAKKPIDYVASGTEFYLVIWAPK